VSWRLLVAVVLGFTAFTQAANLTVEIRHTIGGAPLRFEQSQSVDATRRLAVTRLDYLLTEFALLTSDGRALRAGAQAAFLSAGRDRTAFTLPDVPPGSYHGVAFRIGVPPAENTRDASTWPAGHALNPALNGLHWGWQGGYVFLAVEGRMDSTGFSYHLARAENLMTVRLEQPLEITGDTTLALRFDVARIFDSLSVRSGDGSDSTHSAPGDPVAARLKSNIQRAWTLAGTKESAPVARMLAPIAVPPGTTPHVVRIPNGFPGPELPADNPLTVEGIALGERLFHEPLLSANGRQSCASCHQPARSFAEPRPVSLGAAGQSGRRNAPALVNLAWHFSYAWDGRRAKLRDAALAPISDEREMAQPLEQAALKLAASPGYTAQFARAFGVPEKNAVTVARMGLALEQFLLTRVAADSKFDRVLAGTATLSDEEARGFTLFHTEHDPARGIRGADCFHCHGGFNFSDHAFHDIGLASGDPGRFDATARESDRGKFKTPTLRQLSHTAPYFHDGRAATLDEALTHYDHGFQRTPNLDPNLAKRTTLNLTPEERRALLAFLQTLSD
jgi:cytochrome c peroxidase